MRKRAGEAGFVTFAKVIMLDICERYITLYWLKFGKEKRLIPLMKQTHMLSLEEVGIQALTFIAQDEEKLIRFLQLTGLSPQTLRSAVSEPGFYEGVLNHITGYEPLLLEFAQWANYLPEDICSLVTLKGDAWN